MNTLNRKSFVLFAVCLSAAAWSQQVDARLGDHPAVIVQRLHAQQGYDYASKFYPHPAWLYLQADAPRVMMEHPAVTVFGRHRHDTSATSKTTPFELAGR